MSMNLRAMSMQRVVKAQRSVRAAPVSIKRAQRIIAFAEGDKKYDDQLSTSIIEIISEQLGGESKVTANSSFTDIGADSLDTVEIMMALEEEYDIKLEDDANADKITYVYEAIDTVRDLMKKEG